MVLQHLHRRLKLKLYVSKPQVAACMLSQQDPQRTSMLHAGQRVCLTFAVLRLTRGKVPCRADDDVSQLMHTRLFWIWAWLSAHPQLLLSSLELWVRLLLAAKIGSGRHRGKQGLLLAQPVAASAADA